MYATGQALDENGSYIYDANGYLAGGHAWNYIGMPDGKWYLQDSTWNDVGAKSDETYLLCADDTSQPNGRIPDGNRWSGLNAFEFVPRSSSKYDYEHSTEKFTLSKNEINLLPKKSEELTYSNTYISNENVPKVWASSNEKVAKVDKNGKVTAVAPGSAEITLTAAGMTAKCTVNVHQINSIMFEEGGKASLTTSCGIVDGSTPEIQHIYLTVNQKAENPKYTAEELKDVFGDFGAKSSKTDIATVSASLTGNTIDLAIQPVAKGKTTITVTLGTKKATLNFSVSEKLDEKWFNLPDFKANVDYTGKAYKPKVELTQLGKDKKVKYKVTYKNNKDAGDASVVITGTGTFGGELKYDFTINPLVLKVDLDTIKVTDKPVLYNGGANLTKSTVKHIDESGKKPKKVGLKAGKDYEIRYTNKDTKVTTAEPTVVGEYTMAIVGKGNYAGGANTPVPIRDADGNDKIWTIEKTDFKKVKVNVKVTGTTVAVTVAIGKNVLPATDYTMGFYKDKNCTESVSPTSFAAKTQYYIKVVPKGSNINSEDDKNNKPIVKNFKTK
ncbi:MAG: Ig-like domain-containing protein [Lachnospiraceae bacterium]|nr:Ig-like domain-containing protein [Lachnospiraceae bacterium]